MRISVAARSGASCSSFATDAKILGLPQPAAHCPAFSIALGTTALTFQAVVTRVPAMGQADEAQDAAPY